MTLSLRAAGQTGSVPSTAADRPGDISASPRLVTPGRVLPWIRIGFVSLILAAGVWLIFWRFGPPDPALYPGVSLHAFATILAFMVGLIFTGMAEWIWSARRVRRRLLWQVEQLESRVALLEKAKAAAPVASVRFEYDSYAQLARLHVTNQGDDGIFRALLTIEGSLSTRITRPVFAQWEHKDEPQTVIPGGETRTLRLASLDVETFPFAKWGVHMTSDEGPVTVPAMHSSVIGGTPETQAPPIYLEVALRTRDSERPSMSTIALYPFEAQKL